MINEKILFINYYFLCVFKVTLGQEQFRMVSKFGLAAGLTPTWIIPDINELNVMLPALGIEKLPTSGIFALGGGGYAYILFIDNIRIGGIGFGGKLSNDAVNDGIITQVDYSLGAGALTIEYTMPFIKEFALSIGVMIGAGYREIQLYKNNQNFAWDDIWGEFNNSSENISRTLENKYFTLSPTLNIDYPLNRFIAFRLGGGYLVSFSDKWKIENAQELVNVPSSLSKNNIFIQTGIFIGFFAF
jgi:hypothetical protein